jgi:hypothetical protein
LEVCEYIGFCSCLFVGLFLIQKFESLGAALQFAYPEIDWDHAKFSFKGKKSEQRRLKSNIEEILHGVEVIEDYLHPELAWGKFCFNLVF